MITTLITTTTEKTTVRPTSRKLQKRVVVTSLLCLAGILLGCSGSGSGDPEIDKAEQIVKDGSVKTMTLNDLTQLFGKPNADGYFKDWDSAFVLGFDKRAYSVDSSWLVVNYGADGKVTEARIAQD